MELFSKGSPDLRTELILALHRGAGCCTQVKEDLKKLSLAENLSRTTGYPTPALNIVGTTAKILKGWDVKSSSIIDRMSTMDGAQTRATIQEINDYCSSLLDAPIALITYIHKGNALCFRIKEEQRKIEAAAQKLKEKGFYATAAMVGKPLVTLIESWNRLRDEVISESDFMDRVHVKDATEKVKALSCALESAPSAVALVEYADTTTEITLRKAINDTKDSLYEYATLILGENSINPNDKRVSERKEFVNQIGKMGDPTKISSFLALERHHERMLNLIKKAQGLLDAPA